MWNLFFNPLELTATLTGIISVILSWRKNIYTYFFGIISVSIYVFLCFKNGIYADMFINIFYFIMSVYGWINWHSHQQKSNVFVPFKLNLNNRLFYFLVTLIFWVIIYFVLINYTDSNIPLADSFTTAFFCTGMILMAGKYIENWIYLVIGNIVSIPLYIYKELYVTSFFFVILTVFGCLGYMNWRKDLKTITT